MNGSDSDNTCTPVLLSVRMVMVLPLSAVDQRSHPSRAIRATCVSVVSTPVKTKFRLSLRIFIPTACMRSPWISFNVTGTLMIVSTEK